ncbi:MAG: septum formation initiator family protein [Chlorobi bacterium]|jgi:cell division protein FtsB|nr:septum formation initiator family protein [Chlorobiota bacterium]
MRIFRRPGFWIAVACAGLAAWLLFSRYGVLTRLSLESTDSQLDRDIATERGRLDSLRAYRQRLLSDTVLIERYARERYGMIAPGEVVLIVADSSQ